MLPPIDSFERADSHPDVLLPRSRHQRARLGCSATPHRQATRICFLQGIATRAPCKSRFPQATRSHLPCSHASTRSRLASDYVPLWQVTRLRVGRYVADASKVSSSPLTDTDKAFHHKQKKEYQHNQKRTFDRNLTRRKVIFAIIIFKRVSVRGFSRKRTWDVAERKRGVF